MWLYIGWLADRLLLLYGPDVLPVTQTTVSKHRRKHKALTTTSGLVLSFFSSTTGLPRRGVVLFMLAPRYRVPNEICRKVLISMEKKKCDQQKLITAFQIDAGLFMWTTNNNKHCINHSFNLHETKLHVTHLYLPHHISCKIFLCNSLSAVCSTRFIQCFAVVGWVTGKVTLYNTTCTSDR